MYRKTAGRPLLLVFPFGLLSHYLRCLVLCRELKEFFDIRFAFHPSYQAFIEEEGFDTFVYKELDSSKVVNELKSFQFSWLKSDLPGELFSGQVSIINDLKPAAVLGDHSPTLKMAAEKTGVFYISLINGYLSKFYAGNRAISRRHPMYKWMRLVKGSLKTRLTRWGEARAFHHLHKRFREIRSNNRLRRQHNYLDELEGDLTLICDLPALFPQRRLPSGYLNTGPLFYDLEKPIKADLNETLSVRSSSGQKVVEDADKRSGNQARELIVVAMGSTGDWSTMKFLNDEYFSRYFIIALGDSEQVLDGNHISHLQFATCAQLFPFADMLICHGGNGTLYQGLLYKLPILAYTAHCEQEWNIQALEEHQLGFCLDGIEDPVQIKHLIAEHLSTKASPQREAFRRMMITSTAQLSETATRVAESVLTNKPGYLPRHRKSIGKRDKILPRLQLD